MLNEATSSRLMDDYLTECWTEPTTDLYDFVEDKYNQLIKDYGFNKIQTAIGVVYLIKRRLKMKIGQLQPKNYQSVKF